VIHWPKSIPKSGDVIVASDERKGIVVENDLDPEGNPTDGLQIWFFDTGKRERALAQDIKIVSRK